MAYSLNFQFPKEKRINTLFESIPMNWIRKRRFLKKKINSFFPPCSFDCNTRNMYKSESEQIINQHLTWIIEQKNLEALIVN